MAALCKHTPIEVELALRDAEPGPPFPPITDRAAWEGVRDRLGDVAVAALIVRAETAAATPIPALPASLFLDFDRTGERDRYQQPCFERGTQLAALVLAECLEDRGRFLDPILDRAWAICEQSSWVWPAHQRTLSLPIELQIDWRRPRNRDPMHALPDVERPVIDLGVAGTALMLAECDALVGTRLDPMLGKRIRYEVDRRCFTPFLTRHDFHWMSSTTRRGVNNWTAVCVCGIVGAATYLEADPARLAELIARGARSLADYLDTFDPDGGSTEGPGYWSYGFGHYTIAAHLIEHRTGGRIDLLDGEIFRDIARYPARTVLSPGQYVNFSDCDRDVKLIPAHLAQLAGRLDLPELTALAQTQPSAPREDGLTWRLRELFWLPSAEPKPFRPAAHDFFSGMHWMIARLDPTDRDGLVLAAKGGHNGEMHNQNDVGNIIVHWRGESLVADLGRGRYTGAYFGPERYDHLVNSSLGHSVPVVNGRVQQAGSEYAAELVAHRQSNADTEHDDELLAHHPSNAADTLSLELKGAYPADAGLASLRRTVTLHRDRVVGAVSLEDAVHFERRPGMFESVLTTFAEAEIADGAVVIRGERGSLAVHYDQAVVVPRVELIPDVDLAEGPTAVRRIVFATPGPVQAATIRLDLEPLPTDPRAVE